MRTLLAGRIDIHPNDAYAGEQLSQLFLDPLRACAEISDMLALAVRASLRRALRVSAVVAAKHAALLMERQRDLAVRAACRVAAGAAHDERAVAAPVQEQHR